MLNHYLTVALRHWRRYKTYTLLNLVGLAVGMAAAVVILLYVRAELTYDTFHDHADQLYRVVDDQHAITAGPVGPRLAETVPGLASYARILPTLGDVLIRQGETQRFYESRFYWADSTTLDLLTYPLVQGNPATALAELNSLVITESMAQKYFGDADPMGQTMIFDVGMEAELTVTGVMADPPPNAHFRPDFLAAMVTFDNFGFINFRDWSSRLFHTYVRLDANTSSKAIEAQLPAFFEQETGTAQTNVSLQPITDIHLHSRLYGELEPPGEVTYVYLFALIAALILGMACINFMNLTTARSAHRAREVSMRKVCGASRALLAWQFLGESLLMALFALLLALPLIYAALPFFSDIIGNDLVLHGADLPWLGATLVLLTVVVGTLAGSYPAFFLSSFRPLKVLKGNLGGSDGKPWVRQVLVVAQFTIGLTLMIGVLVMHRQMAFLQEKNLGFNTEQTLVLSARTYGHATQPLPFEAMLEEIRTLSQVTSAAATGNVPGMNPRQGYFLPEGLTDRDQMESTNWNLYEVDDGFIETLGLDLAAGRSFDRAIPTDAIDAYVINETAAQALQALLGADAENPVGKQLDRYVRTQAGWALARPGRIIGVVRDFHYQSLHHPVEPLVLQVNRPFRDHVLVRLAPGNPAATLAELETLWKQFLPERPFEYYFLDEGFDGLYRAEQRVTRLVDVFSVLSLLVCCLGLFGLATFTVERRTKEVGIRKVMGATVPGLVTLLARDFTRLVLIAFAVAAPVAYVALRFWLAGFAYRTSLGVGVFVLAGGLALALALVTVSYQSVRAALSDPVHSLRQE